MPTVLTIDGFRLFFFSHEGNEPAHIHAEKGGAACKWWLSPIDLAWNKGFKPAQVRELRMIIIEHHARLLEAWNTRHGH